MFTKQAKVTIVKYMVEWIENKKLWTKIFDTETEARKFTDDLYNGYLIPASVRRVRYIP